MGACLWRAYRVIREPLILKKWSNSSGRICNRFVQDENLCGDRTKPRHHTTTNKYLFCRYRFFIDDYFQVRGHVLVQLDRDDELPDALERFVQLNLAAVDMEALLLERLSNIAGRDRSRSE